MFCSAVFIGYRFVNLYKFLIKGLSRFLHNIIIIFLLFAKISFASAVVEEIIDHKNRLASNNLQDHLSVIENINFDNISDDYDVDEAQLNSSNSGRRFSSEQSFMKFSDFNFLDSFSAVQYPILLKQKQVSFIQRRLATCRFQFFTVHLMSPF